jgi:hypothetical protein
VGIESEQDGYDPGVRSAVDRDELALNDTLIGVGFCLTFKFYWLIWVRSAVLYHSLRRAECARGNIDTHLMSV